MRFAKKYMFLFPLVLKDEVVLLSIKHLVICQINVMALGRKHQFSKNEQ